MDINTPVQRDHRPQLLSTSSNLVRWVRQPWYRHLPLDISPVVMSVEGRNTTRLQLQPSIQPLLTVAPEVTSATTMPCVQRQRRPVIRCWCLGGRLPLGTVHKETIKESTVSRSIQNFSKLYPANSIYPTLSIESWSKTCFYVFALGMSFPVFKSYPVFALRPSHRWMWVRDYIP